MVPTCSWSQTRAEREATERPSAGDPELGRMVPVGVIWPRVAGKPVNRVRVRRRVQLLAVSGTSAPLREESGATPSGSSQRVYLRLQLSHSGLVNRLPASSARQ